MGIVYLAHHLHLGKTFAIKFVNSEALENAEAVSRFVQDKDRGAVIRQVYAIWDLMVARDVRYSDITATAADSSEVLSQHVRMIEETANNAQANCVDGSVLLVSMLRKIGIDAALVLEPGHCYIAFAVEPKGEELYGLETTLIDSAADEPEELPEFLENAVVEDLRGDRSWPSFIAALGHTTQKLRVNNEKYKSKVDVDYKIISITAARQQGVLPIAFDAKEQFVSYDHSVYLTSTDADEYQELATEEESSDESEMDTEDSADEDWGDEDEAEDE